MPLNKFKILIQKVSVDKNGNKCVYDSINKVITTKEKCTNLSQPLIDYEFDKVLKYMTISNRKKKN